jgi:hypothetical protein
MPVPPRPGPRPIIKTPPPPVPGQGGRPVSPVLDAPVTPPPPERPPYTKYAFLNPYNLSLLAGSLAMSLLTGNPLVAVVALGAEAIWMLNAPGSRALQRLLWDPQHDRAVKAWEAQQRATRVMLLNPQDRGRVDRLVQLKRDIQRLANQNPSFTGELLRAELAKTETLADSFLEMAVTCARYEQYLGSVDLPGLDNERARWDLAVRESTGDAQQVEIAKRNLAIIMKRFEKVQEIRRYLDVARGELDLIENSFRLLADQIVTMQSPHELAGQLDELLTSVEAIRESAVDTEKMLNGMTVSQSA